MEKFSDRATYKGIVLIGDFPPVIGKDFYERDKNLRGPPILSEEARGYFTVPLGWQLEPFEKILIYRVLMNPTRENIKVSQRPTQNIQMRKTPWSRSLEASQARLGSFGVQGLGLRS